MAVTEQQIIQALSTVNDPEIKRDLVSLGMIKDIKVEGGAVSFQVELTTPACPLKNTIREDCEKAVKAVEGVTDVTIEFGAKVRHNVASTDENLIPGVKNVILVGSGKGGVGKSTVALNLACALVKQGASVGLMDADVYGPSIPTMLNAIHARPTMDHNREKIFPLEIEGLKVMSVGFMMEANTPVIWRGPMLSSLITQFLSDVAWGELDYMVVDLPPGTGDVQLTFAQKIKATGAVLVTTPQNVALSDVYRAKYMFDKVEVPVLGLIENMSTFVCPDCGKAHDIFRSGGGERASQDLGIRLFGKIPIDPEISQGGDAGKPAVIAHPDSAYAKTFIEVAQLIASKLCSDTLNA